MEEMELLSFQMIASVGTARSLYLEAIQQARLGCFEEAENLIKEGNANYLEGHLVHAKLLQQEASGQLDSIKVLQVHALDLLVSAETLGILANEIIAVYKKMSFEGN